MADDATDLVADAPDVSRGGLVVTGQAPWTTAGATTTGGEAKPGVWHKVHAISAGTCTFNHALSPSGDTYMSVYSGPSNATQLSDLTLLASNDDSFGGAKPICTVTSTGGTWFYIWSVMWSGTSATTYYMQWSLPAVNWFLSVDGFGSADFTLAGVLLALPSAIAQGTGYAAYGSPYGKIRPIQKVHPQPRLVTTLGAALRKPYLPPLNEIGNAQTGPVKILKPNMSPGSGGGDTGGGGGGYDADDGQGWPRGVKGPS